MNSSSGERRLLTILFADLSGFTALSSQVDPEEVGEIASTGFEYLNKPIVNQGGTIHKYDGDLVIALFGHPQSHEDDPERAIKAGLAMMTQVDKINEALSGKLKKNPDLGLHIGITNGVVYVGEVGSREKKEYTVMGDVVNLAARLKDVARRSEIVVSEPVFRASRYLFDYEALPPVSLKGIAEPVRVFMPIRIRSKPEPKRGITGLHSPMIGRRAELERLTRAVQGVTEGRPSINFVVGDPGIGKSRLLAELRREISCRGFEVAALEGKCLSHGENIPYRPFLGILESVFGIAETDAPPARRDKVISATRDICPEEWAEIAPYIGHLFSLRFDDDLDGRVKYLDAQGKKIQIIRSIKKLFGGLARRRPLVLVIDDYQWIDEESLELIESLFGPALCERIMFLGLSRIDKEKACFRTKERLSKIAGIEFHEVALAPLNPEEAGELVNNLLQIPGIDAGFEKILLEHAEGNPFFTEEIIRSLIDTGVLVNERGAWKLTADVSAIKAPDSVQALVTARFDRVEAELRRILQIASAIGRTFYERVLEKISGADSLMLVLNLATLEDLEYIKKIDSAGPTESEYAFRHPLLPEIIYGNLVKGQRRELHGRVAGAIEELYPDRLEEMAEILAYQYLNSDDQVKAVRWLMKAGQKARDSFANEEAVNYYSETAAILEKSLESDADRLFAAYEAVGEIRMLRCEYPQALSSAEQMLRVAAGDRIRQSKAKRFKAAVLCAQMNAETSLKLLDESEKMLTEETPASLIERAAIHFQRGEIKTDLGRLKEGGAECRQGLDIVDRLFGDGAAEGDAALQDLRARGFGSLAAALTYTGEYRRAIELLERSIGIFESLGNRLQAEKQRSRIAKIHLYQGDLNRAAEIWEQTLKNVERMGDREMTAGCCINLGIVIGFQGDLDKAIEYYYRATSIADEIGDRRVTAAALINLGAILMVRGEYAVAVDHLTRTIALKQEEGDPRTIAIAEGNLGTIFNEQGEYAIALEYFNKSLRGLEKSEDKKYASTARILLAEYYRSTGDNDKAAAYNSSAMETFVAIGDKLGIGVAHTSTAAVYIDRGMLAPAAEHLKKAEEILIAVSEKTMLIDLYHTCALYHIACLRAGAVDNAASAAAAERYLRLSRQLCTALKARYFLARNDYFEGMLHAAGKEPDKAAACFQNSIAILRAINGRGMLPDVLAAYARLLARRAAANPAAGQEAGGLFDEARAIYAAQKLAHKAGRLDEERRSL